MTITTNRIHSSTSSTARPLDVGDPRVVDSDENKRTPHMGMFSSESTRKVVRVGPPRTGPTRGGGPPRGPQHGATGSPEIQLTQEPEDGMLLCQLDLSTPAPKMVATSAPRSESGAPRSKMVASGAETTAAGTATRPPADTRETSKTVPTTAATSPWEANEDGVPPGEESGRAGPRPSRGGGAPPASPALAPTRLLFSESESPVAWSGEDGGGVIITKTLSHSSQHQPVGSLKRVVRSPCKKGGKLSDQFASLQILATHKTASPCQTQEEFLQGLVQRSHGGNSASVRGRENNRAGDAERRGDLLLPGRGSSSCVAGSLPAPVKRGGRGTRSPYLVHIPRKKGTRPMKIYLVQGPAHQRTKGGSVDMRADLISGKLGHHIKLPDESPLCCNEVKCLSG